MSQLQAKENLDKAIELLLGVAPNEAQESGVCQICDNDTKAMKNRRIYRVDIRGRDLLICTSCEIMFRKAWSLEQVGTYRATVESSLINIYSLVLMTSDEGVARVLAHRLGKKAHKMASQPTT